MTPSLDSSGTIAQLLAQGRLVDAVAQATAAVKSCPADTAARILLADLLCLEGALDRADAHLQIASQQAPAEAVGIAQLRRLVRAEAARRAWYVDAALPNFVGAPSERQRRALQLALAVRAGDATEAAALLGSLERTHVPHHGTCDGSPFDDFRDADDLLQENVELLSPNGRYYWIEPQALASLTFTAPRRPRDLLWRHAKAVFRNGEQNDLRLPARYWDEASLDAHRLVHRTDWVPATGGIMRGRGQRVFITGDEVRGLMDITQLTFREAA
jgi:type VI secretion system protein ImpE